LSRRSNAPQKQTAIQHSEPSAGFNPHLGTAGGDFAELAGGIATYFKVMNEAPSEVRLFSRWVWRARALTLSPRAAPVARPFYPLTRRPRPAIQTSEIKPQEAIKKIFERFMK
jgi:hypothetical protein